MGLQFRVFVCLTLVQVLLVCVARAAGLSSYTEQVIRESQVAILEGIPEEYDRSVLLQEDLQAKTAFSPEKQRMLDAMSGPSSHDPAKAQLGERLGKAASPMETVSMGVMVREAVERNIDVQMARLLPPLREADILEARSFYDWETFASASYSHTDLPEPASAFEGIPISGDETVQITSEGRLGFRRRLVTGAQLEASTGLIYRNDRSEGREYIPDPARLSDAVIKLRQPLLRNAWSTVNNFRIVFAENTKERDKFLMEQTLSQVALDTEKAYWELSNALYRLLVAQELLERTEETYRILESRNGIDVKPLQISQAGSFLLSRMAETKAYQAELRNAGDRLKEIINSSNLQLLDETVPIPVDRPEIFPESLTLRAAVDTALRQNAELRQAVLDLENSHLEWEAVSIQRMPELNLELGGRVSGMGDNVSNAYSDMDQHLSGQVKLELIVPLENRAARSALDRARLTRQDRKLNYLKKARTVVRAVKESLRKVQLTYALTRITREARLAAAENLRTLQEREKDAESLTPEFLLDLKLATQQRLAEAEIREYQALTDFRIAFASYYHESGILLERLGIVAIHDELHNGLDERSVWNSFGNHD